MFKSTLATECPWLARMRSPSVLSANRCLSLVATQDKIETQRIHTRGRNEYKMVAPAPLADKIARYDPRERLECAVTPAARGNR